MRRVDSGGVFSVRLLLVAEISPFGLDRSVLAGLLISKSQPEPTDATPSTVLVKRVKRGVFGTCFT